jgi:hypothetical protein
MPDRFATAVWVNPAAIRHCRTFFPKRDTPLLLLVLEYGADFRRFRKARTRHHGLSR